MISFLRGNVKKFLFDPKRIILLFNDFGYEIYIPEYLSDVLIENGIEENSYVGLEIYYHVTERQPKPLLVGFLNSQDKDFFEQLIQVEGIGPLKAANSLVFPINNIAHAIESEDFTLLEQMPGIGSRAAQKIVATLKGKVLDKTLNYELNNNKTKISDSIFEDSKSALVGLGYRSNEAINEINTAVANIDNLDKLTVEILLREVFRKNRKQ